ncbi:ComEC/Rec2 family competence protein [Clostridiaceae bacterium 35-E11]
MIRKKNSLQGILLILTLFITILLGACSKHEETSSTPQSVKEELEVHFIDVGQADSILVRNKDAFILIDAGNNEDETLVVDYLKKQKVKKLDYVIGTHPHEDHIGGLDAVINEFDLSTIYMPKVSHTSKTYKDVLIAIKNKKLKIEVPTVGTKFQVGDAEGMILAPNANAYEDLNNYSIVIKLTHGDNTFLFTGDAEKISEEEMMNKRFDLSADVLKLGHHGSHSSTTPKFLDRVNPQYAVIMVGKENDYKHPHKEVMDQLKDKGIKVYRTDQNGTIVITSDKKSLTFHGTIGDYRYGSEKDSTVENTAISTKDVVTPVEKAAVNSTEEIYVDTAGKGLIKGNINSKKEKIYHLPGGAYYEGTEPEVWFKTESEAQQAGFRKSKR